MHDPSRHQISSSSSAFTPITISSVTRFAALSRRGCHYGHGPWTFPRPGAAWPAVCSCQPVLPERRRRHAGEEKKKKKHHQQVTCLSLEQNIYTWHGPQASLVQALWTALANIANCLLVDTSSLVRDADLLTNYVHFSIFSSTAKPSMSSNKHARRLAWYTLGCCLSFCPKHQQPW